eukprot:619822-Rhodomonas_salina.1
MTALFRGLLVYFGGSLVCSGPLADLFRDLIYFGRRFCRSSRCGSRGRRRLSRSNPSAPAISRRRSEKSGADLERRVHDLKQESKSEGRAGRTGGTRGWF